MFPTTEPRVNPDVLRAIPLFHLLDESEARILAEQLDHHTYLAGQLIFSAGDRGGTMYVVQSGKVEIFIKDSNGDHVTLSHINANELFGELSLLDSAPRSAYAKAMENTSVFIIDQNDLKILVESHPHAALDMMAMLGQRIREADYLVGTRVVSRNPNDVQEQHLTFSQKLADRLAAVAGDMRFVYFSVVWFTVWIVWNTGQIPGLEPFDPYPFNFLTMVVSLEAIFLATFVLVSQNRQAEREKVRNDIEYEVNIKAELEIRDLHNRLDEIQEIMLTHLKAMNTSIDHVKVHTGIVPAVHPSNHKEEKQG
jgi:CRP/FNR family cyclic AMP-dependent transcriptional regulator